MQARLVRNDEPLTAPSNSTYGCGSDEPPIMCVCIRDRVIWQSKISYENWLPSEHHGFHYGADDDNNEDPCLGMVDSYFEQLQQSPLVQDLC